MAEQSPAHHTLGSSHEQPARAHVGMLSIFRHKKESWAGSPFMLNFVLIEESAEKLSCYLNNPLNND